LQEKKNIHDIFLNTFVFDEKIISNEKFPLLTNAIDNIIDDDRNIFKDL
jgi:hypothetical protein